MSAGNVLPASFEDRKAHQQIRDFAHALDSTSFILRRLDFPLHKLRDVVDGLQGGAGGRFEFELSFLSLARRLRHAGSDETAQTYAQRKVAALDKEQHKAGRLLFTIKRGGGIEHRRTTYLDHLTIAANWMMQQARASELWAVHPGRAIEAFTEAAIEMLPLVQTEAEGDPSPRPLTDDDYISRNFSHVITLAEKNYHRIASRGDDPIVHAEKMAQTLIRRAHDLVKLQAATDGRKKDDDVPFLESDAGRGTNLYPLDEESPEKLSKLEAALMYAARGWRVFPCQDKGKEPRIREWQNLATTDPATIRRWWAKWPDANVAIATGAGSNLIVLDVDFEKGGDDSFSKLTEPHGDIDTARGQTGNGFHFYMQHPGSEIRNSAGRLGKGLDIRGDGGYVVAPPSVHPNGACYEWLKASPVAQMPEWLIKRLTEEKQTVAAASSTKGQPQAQGSAVAGGFIPYQSRNDTLFRIACSLRGKGAQYEEIEAAVFQTYETRCEKSPAMDESELRKIAGSAARYQANSAKAGA